MFVHVICSGISENVLRNAPSSGTFNNSYMDFLHDVVITVDLTNYVEWWTQQGVIRIITMIHLRDDRPNPNDCVLFIAPILIKLSRLIVAPSDTPSAVCTAMVLTEGDICAANSCVVAGISVWIEVVS